MRSVFQPTEGSAVMGDIAFIGGGAFFFALCAALVRLFERI
jgi:hypothetical protein